jgi:hypothetical protein
VRRVGLQLFLRELSSVQPAVDVVEELPTQSLPRVCRPFLQVQREVHQVAQESLDVNIEVGPGLAESVVAVGL